MRRLLPLLLLLLSPGAGAATTASMDTTGFALVLGGGGARGLAHVGVLEVLEEEGLRPSLVVGTSMGAVIGALAACGWSAGEIEDLTREVVWSRFWNRGRLPAAHLQGGFPGLPETPVPLLADRWPPLPPPGLAPGGPLQAAVGQRCAEALLDAGDDFDALPVPFRCTATDLESGELVVLRRGSLARAVRASATIPLLFPPVEWEGRLLVDGGFRAVNPVEVARAAGFRRILIVDVSNVFLPPEDLPGDLYRMWIRTAELNMLPAARVEPREGEILLRCDLRPWRSLSFGAAEEIVEAGRAAAAARRQELRGLGRPGRPAPVRPAPRSRRLEDVQVVGARWLDPARVRNWLGLAEGGEATAEGLWRRAGAAARRPAVDELWLELGPRGRDGLGVTVQVRERRRPRLELAGGYRSDEGPGLRARLHQALLPGGGALALDGWTGERGAGGALRAAQPLGPGPWALLADLRAERERLPLYRGDREVDRAVSTRRRASLRLQWARPALALRAGVHAGGASTHPESRLAPGRPPRRLRALSLEGFWPGPSGLSRQDEEGARLRWWRALPEMGGEEDFWSVEGGLVLTPGPVTSLGRARLAAGGAVSDRRTPLAWRPRAGDPRGWAGLRTDEILQARFLWLRGAWARPVVLGLEAEGALAVGWAHEESLEAASPRTGGALTVSLRTPLGPVRVGWELAEHRRGRIFVLLGPRLR